ncbi:MAG: sodium:solute symporter family protein [Ignavibacteriae bacterium]|nr:sodium:solute symporter family protein [Ignavibacteriota bacterium]
MVSLSTIDLVLIVGYFAAVLTIGFLTTKRHADAADYLLAGRSLTLPLFVMTLVSTWYGGILGVGEFSYLYGISNWVVQGVPYYIFAMVFAFLLAKRIRASNLLTIPDKLQQAYDRKTALLGSFLVFILMTPAPYILMLGVLIQLVSGWSLFACIIVGTAATTAYLFFGGFRSDMYTDAFEFVLMFVGFGVILPFAYWKFGGLDFIVQSVPPLHLSWDGGNSLQFVLVWFFIALWTLVDPSFHQRCYAAKSGEVAQKGILVSIIFWFVFDAMTATAGLYARAALPSIANPVMAFPLLAEVTLPPVAKGMFYIGMLATIMSTLNTLAFVSATTIGRDIVWRMRREKDENNVASYTRWGLLVAATLSIVLCLLIPSVIKLWYTIGTVIIPGLLIPLVSSYFQRWKVDAKYAFVAMLLGWLTSFVWLLVGWKQDLASSAHYPFGIEPMYPGLVVSTVVWGIGLTSENR